MFQQPESRDVRTQQQRCSVGNVSNISQAHVDDNTPQNVDKSCLSYYQSVSITSHDRRLFLQLLSTHADRHAGDISFTVCLCVCVSAGFFVRDISGVGWPKAMKLCRMVDLGVHQVISPFGELRPRG